MRRAKRKGRGEEEEVRREELPLGGKQAVDTNGAASVDAAGGDADLRCRR